MIFFVTKAYVKIQKFADFRWKSKSSNRLRIVAKWDMGTFDGAKWSPGSKESKNIKIWPIPAEFPAGSAIIAIIYYGWSGRKFGRKSFNFNFDGFFGPRGSFCTVARPHISFCDDSEPIWRFPFFDQNGIFAMVENFQDLDFGQKFRRKIFWTKSLYEKLQNTLGHLTHQDSALYDQNSDISFFWRNGHFGTFLGNFLEMR